MNKSIKVRANLKTILVFSFFSVFLFGLLSFHMFNRFIEESRIKFDIPTFLIFFIFLFLLFSTSFFGLNFFSNIEINEDKIIIKKLFYKKHIEIANIKKIVLSEIHNSYEILFDRTRIQLKNNEIINLYSFKYHDFFKLKIVLNYINKNLESESSKILKLNIESILPKKKSFKIIPNDKSTTFIFTHFLTLPGIFFYGLTLMMLNSLFNKEVTNIYNILELLFAIIFLFILFSNQLHYFTITNNYLIVKNSFRFWDKKYFDLNEIESIEIHRHFRQSGKTIVIKTKQFENKTFASENLLEKHWVAFKTVLRNKNIDVFDDSYKTSKNVFY
jgi:hypothetical protein